MILLTISYLHFGVAEIYLTFKLCDFRFYSAAYAKTNDEEKEEEEKEKKP